MPAGGCDADNLRDAQEPEVCFVDTGEYSVLMMTPDATSSIMKKSEETMRDVKISPGCVCYQIRVRGRVDDVWADWFDQFEMTYTEGCTLLTGPVADQSALLGLLMKLHDLGLGLIAVNPVATPVTQAVV